MKARYISVPGDNKKHSEDFSYTGLRKGRLVAAVGDWATNLIGGLYIDRETALAFGHSPNTQYSGGSIGAQIARRVVEKSESTGHKLVGEINNALAAKYEELADRGHEELRNFREDPRLCFTGFLAHVTATHDEMTLTSVGDVMIYMNGKRLAGEETKIQRFLNVVRQAYIDATGDINGAYDVIKPIIREQYRWQNGTHPLSCASINGNPMPAKGIVTSTIINMPKKHASLLLFSDGYVTPSDLTIEGLEDMLAYVYRVDPYRCKQFPAVGTLKDDRTALEISLNQNWDALFIEEIKSGAA